GTAYRNAIRRVTVQDFTDPHYYDTFTCCPTNVQYKDVVQKSRGEQVDLQCPTQGALKIKLTPEPGDPISGNSGNPGTFTWFQGDPSAQVAATVLFGQAPMLEAFWEDSSSSTPSSETVTWEVGGETAPSADSSGLYPNKPEVLFTGGQSPYTGDQLRFQSVHTGQFTLTITTTNPDHKGPDGQSAHITLAISITAPDGLLSGPGPVNTAYDGLIVSYADKYGIPPQYIKRQVWQESGQTYNPATYRYEPLSWDIGTRGGVGADFGGIWQWSSSQWEEQGMDSYEFPTGGGFTSADMGLRDKFHFIASFDPSVQPPSLPYTCGQYDASNDYTEKLVDLFQAEDGWRPNSYPHQIYNAPGQDTVKGPCGGVRMNWSLWAGVTMAYYANQYYCGGTTLWGQACGWRQQSFIAWFCNHPDTPAQSAIAASYGLLQLMYYKAVIDLHWNQQLGPETRDPASLFDPAVSLDLGTHADCVFVQDNIASRICSPPDLLSYQQAMADGIRFYNKSWNGGTYGLGIVKGAYGFRPQ
ncbi:MAG: hypothetical protein WBS54_08490, partial [Acidobacteriota bacterium]